LLPISGIVAVRVAHPRRSGAASTADQGEIRLRRGVVPSWVLPGNAAAKDGQHQQVTARIRAVPRPMVRDRCHEEIPITVPAIHYPSIPDPCGNLAVWL
jgi:hypothetical protein